MTLDMMDIENYEILNEKFAMDNHNRKCIDGTITGSGKCVGYCRFSDHAGFLTKELRKDHDCIKKQCRYYVGKSVFKEKTISPFENVIACRTASAQEAFSMARAMTAENNGLVVNDFNLSDDFACELSYVTITNDYEFEPIIEKIQKKTGLSVRMKKLNCPFDVAVNIILTEKSA